MPELRGKALEAFVEFCRIANQERRWLWSHWTCNYYKVSIEVFYKRCTSLQQGSNATYSDVVMRLHSMLWQWTKGLKRKDSLMIQDQLLQISISSNDYSYRGDGGLVLKCGWEYANTSVCRVWTQMCLGISSSELITNVIFTISTYTFWCPGIPWAGPGLREQLLSQEQNEEMKTERIQISLYLRFAHLIKAELNCMLAPQTEKAI